MHFWALADARLREGLDKHILPLKFLERTDVTSSLKVGQTLLRRRSAQILFVGTLLANRL